MSSKSAEQLRHALSNADRSGRGRPYPVALRSTVSTFARQRQADGQSMSEIADSLGLSAITLRRWLESSTPTPALALFRPVALASVVPDERSPRRAGLVVFGPAGLRIEGLDLDTLTQLVRRLG